MTMFFERLGILIEPFSFFLFFLVLGYLIFFGVAMAVDGKKA
jgi:hypothetical protein